MGGSIEDTMFFPRLRRHAKWMFVFLALVFALGFVGFGVGAGGVGIGNIFDNQGTGSGVSVSSARENTEKNPQDPEAWREYATALQTEGETAQAVVALERAVELEPKDLSLLRELSALYIAQGTERSRAAQAAQAGASAGAAVPGGLTSSDGVPLVTDKVAEALSGKGAVEAQLAQGEAQIAFTKAVETYKKIAKLQPTDPNVQLELAQTAQSAGDDKTAVAAYERFIELAPDDPTAALVKKQLDAYKKAVAGQG
jgi:tetratricopeptide (TPR) repeat protein